MPAIKSLEELKRVREEALQKKQMKATVGNVQVIVVNDDVQGKQRPNKFPQILKKVQSQ